MIRAQDAPVNVVRRGTRVKSPKRAKRRKRAACRRIERASCCAGGNVPRHIVVGRVMLSSGVKRRACSNRCLVAKVAGCHARQADGSGLPATRFDVTSERGSAATARLHASVASLEGPGRWRGWATSGRPEYRPHHDRIERCRSEDHPDECVHPAAQVAAHQLPLLLGGGVVVNLGNTHHDGPIPRQRG
jgi:hypothetical protein